MSYTYDILSQYRFLPLFIKCTPIQNQRKTAREHVVLKKKSFFTKKKQEKAKNFKYNEH